MFSLRTSFKPVIRSNARQINSSKHKAWPNCRKLDASTTKRTACIYNECLFKFSFVCFFLSVSRKFRVTDNVLNSASFSSVSLMKKNPLLELERWHDASAKTKLRKVIFFKAYVSCLRLRSESINKFNEEWTSFTSTSISNQCLVLLPRI